MKLNAYCNECLTRTKQHCGGRDDDTADDAAHTENSVQVVRADGSYEVVPDYIQTGSSGGNKPHGLKFCPNYQLDPAQLPRAKSAKAIRDEFNAQRAANKAATKAERDAAKTEKQVAKAEKVKLKAAERKLKAKQKEQARRDRNAEARAKQLTPVVVRTMDDDEFSDLII